jgi:hypothetical protein
MELPQLSQHCKTGICSSSDLAAVLKRPEYRIIWTADAAEYLPKSVATELINSFYVHPLIGKQQLSSGADEE